MNDRDAGQAPAAATERLPHKGGFTALPRGTRLDHFVIDTVLGAGGFGITYLAQHDTLKKPYALKEYFPRDFAYREGLSVLSMQTAQRTFSWGLARFLDEARALAKFKHPAIVDVAHVFEMNGTAYMALTYEQGRTFSGWLQELGRPPTQAELDRLAAPLLDALEVMHKAGMLHRDIAADNILVRDDGSPVLIDFGSARSDLKERAGPMTAVVKAGNSPPEQYKSDAESQGPWSDIYAFAATLYRATTGRLPMDAMDRMAAPASMPSATAADKAVDGGYRPGFVAAIDWALQLEPAQRPQSIAMWRARLLASGEDAAPTVLAEPYLPPAPPPPPAQRQGWSVAAKVGAAGVVIAAAMMAYAAVRPAPAPPASPLQKQAVAPANPATPSATTAVAPTAQPTPTPATQATSAAASAPAPSTPVAAAPGARPAAPPAATPEARAGIEVAIDLPKTTFAIGDAFTFAVRANRECHLLVFTVDANDTVELHDPAVSGAFMGSPLLKAGETRQIPVPGAPGRAVVKAPAGAYQIGAVCAREDLAKLGLAAPQLRIPASGGKRSFTFKLDEASKSVQRDQLGRVTVGYEVR